VGGAPYYAARALRTLRRPAVVVTKCSRADRDALLPPVVALGVPVHWRPAAATAAFALHYDGDVRSMTVEAVGEPWSPEEATGWVAQALAGVRWVHVAPLLRSDFAPETVAALARGRRLSLDGQGLVRVSTVGPLRLDSDFERDLLRHVSIVKLAEEEAQALLGRIAERSLARLGVPEVVVTHGRRGSTVFAGGRLERIPVRPVRGVDPTGAGDAFAVAYLAARSLGQPPAAAARRASAVVSDLLAARARR
jgi:sugar/nucleoside kinase (ribokinase family)